MNTIYKSPLYNKKKLDFANKICNTIEEEAANILPGGGGGVSPCLYIDPLIHSQVQSI